MFWVLGMFLATLVAGSLSVGRGEERLYFKLNGERKGNHSTITIANSKRTLDLDCYHDITLHPNLSEISASGTTVTKRVTTIATTTVPYIRYKIPASEKSYVHTYQCRERNEFAQVTLEYSSSGFQGLNPLVYTISAVILLGTLAIVAIITCWIRARRSFGVSGVRGNSTPQDYLNYINDEEFTPLTQNEFVASLEERPPSYLESERMEQVSNSEDKNEEEQPSSTRTQLTLAPTRHITTAASNGTRTHGAAASDQRSIAGSHRNTE